MGLKSFETGVGREAIALECDSVIHRKKALTAWFDCGSPSDNLRLASAAGWTKGPDPKGVWLCRQCSDRTTQKRPRCQTVTGTEADARS
jgi:hypothetical protein